MNRVSGPLPRLVVALLVIACTKPDAGSADSTATASPPMSADTGMAMQHGSGMPGMDESPARDADQEFLRMMVDHHQGMIAMADSASTAASTRVKAGATRMSSMQTAEQKTMLGMLKNIYSDDKMPMVMPSNAAMIKKLAGKTGAAFDRQFRESVIAHHEEALGMIDRFAPRLTRPDVRQMAAKMKADQTREISELRRELTGT